MYLTAAFVATVALFAQCGEAVPSGAHYGGGAYGAGGYGAGAYGAGGYGAGGYGAGAYGAGGYGGAAYDGPKYHGPQAIPVVLPDGHIADTHEVAAAKSAHLSAVSKAAASSGYGEYDDGSYAGAGHAGGYGAGTGYAGGYGAGYGQDGGYGAGGYGAGGYGAGGYGAGAGYSGAYGAGYGAGYDGPKYQGPTAIPVVLADGHIADTHEVAAAKGAHYVALAKAETNSHAAGYGEDYDGSYAGGYGSGSYGAGYAGGSGSGSYGAGYAGGPGYAGAGYGSAGGYAGGYNSAGYGGAYHGPLAKPVVLPSGYLADTHDVAANKGAHLTALANAAHSHAGWAPHGHH